MSDLGFYEHGLAAFINAPFWPLILSLGFVCGVAMWAVRKSPTDLVAAAYSATMLSVWPMRWNVLASLGIEPPPGPVEQHWGYAIAPFGIVATIALLAIASSYFAAGSSVPKVEQKAEATKGVQSWLSDVAALVPTGAMAAFARIRGHVEELTRLSTQLPSALPAVSSAEVIVSRDLRDLLVAYKRVEVARRLLPGMANAGDKVLTDGMTRIESALVEMRKNVADEALKTLSVEGRFLELKHGDEDVAAKKFDA